NRSSASGKARHASSDHPAGRRPWRQRGHRARAAASGPAPVHPRHHGMRPRAVDPERAQLCGRGGRPLRRRRQRAMRLDQPGPGVCRRPLGRRLRSLALSRHRSELRQPGDGKLSDDDDHRMAELSADTDRAILHAELRGDAMAGFRALGLSRDRRGGAAITLAISLAGIAGLAGLYVTKRTMQGAADSAAYTAALALNNGASSTAVASQAKSIAASYGFADGSNSVTVTVNTPPLSGNYTNNDSAVEVIVSQPQPLQLAGLFLAAPPT